MKKLITVLLLILLSISILRAQNVIVVDPTGGGNYETIVAAITGAANGDTIKVMPGRYVETFTINKPIHLKAVDTTCILYYPPSAGIGSSAAAVGGSISGFKIQVGAGFSGNGFLIIGNIFENVTISSGGGTLNLVYSQNIFRSCTINLVMGAGNVSFVDNILFSSTVSSSNSAFKSYILHNNFNSSTISSSISGTGSKVISKNIFVNTVNTVTNASISSSSNKKIVFSDNSITGGGTGVFAGSKSLVVANNITGTASRAILIPLYTAFTSIFANTILNNNGYGLYFDFYKANSSNIVLDSLIIKNNVFKGNANSVMHFYYYNSNGTFTIQNHIISNNVFSNNLAGIITIQGNTSANMLFRITNNIFYNNTAGGISFWSNSLILDYNCVFGNGNNTANGLGNIFVDPQFVDPAVNNFRLSITSPCINAGSLSTVEYDLDRTRNDMGIYGGSMNFDNFYGNQSGAKALEFNLRPLNALQGTTITIQGSGVSLRGNTNPVLKEQLKNEVE